MRHHEDDPFKKKKKPGKFPQGRRALQSLPPMREIGAPSLTPHWTTSGTPGIRDGTLDKVQLSQDLNLLLSLSPEAPSQDSKARREGQAQDTRYGTGTGRYG